MQRTRTAAASSTAPQGDHRRDSCKAAGCPEEPCALGQARSGRSNDVSRQMETTTNGSCRELRQDLDLRPSPCQDALARLSYTPLGTSWCRALRHWKTNTSTTGLEPAPSGSTIGRSAIELRALLVHTLRKFYSSGLCLSFSPLLWSDHREHLGHAADRAADEPS
jgi:hypothetical protein